MSKIYSWAGAIVGGVISFLLGTMHVDIIGEVQLMILNYVILSAVATIAIRNKCIDSEPDSYFVTGPIIGGFVGGIIGLILGLFSDEYWLHTDEYWAAVIGCIIFGFVAFIAFTSVLDEEKKYGDFIFIQIFVLIMSLVGGINGLIIGGTAYGIPLFLMFVKTSLAAAIGIFTAIIGTAILGNTVELTIYKIPLFIIPLFALIGYKGGNVLGTWTENKVKQYKLEKENYEYERIDVLRILELVARELAKLDKITAPNEALELIKLAEDAMHSAQNKINTKNIQFAEELANSAEDYIKNAKEIIGRRERQKKGEKIRIGKIKQEILDKIDKIIKEED